MSTPAQHTDRVVPRLAGADLRAAGRARRAQDGTLAAMARSLSHAARAAEGAGAWGAGTWGAGTEAPVGAASGTPEAAAGGLGIRVRRGCPPAVSTRAGRRRAEAQAA